jgi:hypothetical protein
MLCLNSLIIDMALGCPSFVKGCLGRYRKEWRIGGEKSVPSCNRKHPESSRA